ncbi:hypothetical protein [Pseudooceanicola sp. LIPI14-2-Ac024]|uniref:hypothetical protein n=1 Tax=Pseudooceanicola sp. LIPI14-2-Ac024 TaxID=3344875 RepID=UPI0035D03846
MQDWLADIDMGVAQAEEARTRLMQALDDGAEVICLAPDATLDTAGAQLLLAAVQTARSRGRTIRVSIPETAPAAATWIALALDRGAITPAAADAP